MDDKLDKVLKSIEDLKRQIALIQQKQNSQDATLNAVAKDVGIQDSRNMSEILYKMDGYMSRDATNVQSMQAAVEETRRTTVNIELMVKEIMKGLSVIYNSVDELEENIVPERQTK